MYNQGGKGERRKNENTHTQKKIQKEKGGRKTVRQNIQIEAFVDANKSDAALHYSKLADLFIC